MDNLDEGTIVASGGFTTLRGRTGQLDENRLFPADLANGAGVNRASTWQVRLEETAVGRMLINVGLIVTLTAILVAVMPVSHIKAALLGYVNPYLTAVGLGEDWGMFAPGPRTSVVYTSGHIRYSDGTSSQWSFPVRPGLMAYSDYRWQKFEEYVRLDTYKGLWEPFARYLANHHSTPGRTPVQVALIRRWAEIKPPGVTPDRGRWSQYVYFVAPVAPVAPVGAAR
jgi:hypothetical protein